MHGLESKYGGCVDFVYLDVDNTATQSAKTRLGYLAQPNIFLVDGAGKVLWKKFGFVTADELETQIKTVAK